jgi:phospholipase C
MDAPRLIRDDFDTATGCEVGPNLGCFPFSWKTFPEYLEDAGVSWQVYQDTDNFGDDALASFTQFQNAASDSNLAIKGNSYPGLQAFYDDAMNGTLPLVSWIVGPAELSEHNPYMPKDGAWLIQQIVNAVTQGASAQDTALFVMYDETGGWGGEHSTPDYFQPSGCSGMDQRLTVPENRSRRTLSQPQRDCCRVDGGSVRQRRIYLHWAWQVTAVDVKGPAALPVLTTVLFAGFRVPMHIISPWTRGQKVFTEHADHASQILFVGK